MTEVEGGAARSAPATLNACAWAPSIRTPSGTRELEISHRIGDELSGHLAVVVAPVPLAAPGRPFAASSRHGPIDY